MFAYELAYKFKFNELKKYFKDEQEFIKALNLNLKINIQTINASITPFLFFAKSKTIQTFC